MLDLNAISNMILLHLLLASVQAAALIGLTWVLCRLLPRLPATVRCALWWLVAAQLVLGLVWPIAVRLPVLQPAPIATIAAQTLATSPRLVETPLAVTSTKPAWLAHPATLPGKGLRASKPLSWRTILLALWLAGLALQLAMAKRQWQHARRLRDASHPMHDAQLQALCRRQAQHLGLRDCPELRVCDAIETPQVMGLRHPVVLWPAQHALVPYESEMALAHELAHLHRDDLWLVWVPVVARWLFFFHPLVHIAVREYGLNREVACDGQALRLQQVSPDTYGRLLLHLGLGPLMPVGLSSVASPSFRHLKRRLVMLGQATNPPCAWHWLLVAVTALLFVVPYRAVAAHQPLVDMGSQGHMSVQHNFPTGSSGHLSMAQDNRHGWLYWHDGQDALVLRSDASGRIHVVTAKPEGLFGLRESDVILRVDGQPVSQVGALLNQLRTRNHEAAHLLLRRNGASCEVTLTASEYGRILSPPAPPPAPPPLPPSSARSQANSQNFGFSAHNIDIRIHTDAPDGIALLTQDSVWIAGTQSDLITAKRLYRNDRNDSLWFRSGAKAYITHDPAVIKQAEAAYAGVVVARCAAANLERKTWEVKGPLEGLRSWQQSIADRRHSLEADPNAPTQRERLASLKAQQHDVASRIARLQKQLAAILNAQEVASVQRLNDAMNTADQRINRLVTRAASEGRVHLTTR